MKFKYAKKDLTGFHRLIVSLVVVVVVVAVVVVVVVAGPNV